MDKMRNFSWYWNFHHTYSPEGKIHGKARNITESEFKGSVYRYHHFLDRNDLSIFHKTMISQKLAENFEEKLQKFKAFITAAE